MEKEKEVKEVKPEPETYTKEEVKANFVTKEQYIAVVSDLQKVTNAFNKLLKEFNDLHLSVLLQDEPKK